jgi:hypothetical protein
MGKGWRTVEGWVWPHGPNPTFDPTQCLSTVIYMCPVCLFTPFPEGFFLVNSVIEEKAKIKGYSRLG